MDSTTTQFRVPVTVRGYELDTQGHLNQAVYLMYAEHARWELLRAAGISQDALLENGIGPVVLETTIKYLRELRGGDEATVSCEFVWGQGKTFHMRQQIVKSDGVLAADLTCVAGILDLNKRRLVPEPAVRLRSIADDPSKLGA